MTDVELGRKLAETMKLPTCSAWAQGFAESIIGQINKGRTISPRQRAVCNKIFNENSEEAQRLLANWNEEYNQVHKSDAIRLAAYYREQAVGYYGDVTRDIVNDKVPSRTKYMRMRNNKYAKKILAELDREPRFTIDDSIMPNSKFLHGYSFHTSMMCKKDGSYPSLSERENFKNRGGIILGVDDKIVSAAKGAKRYLILPLGSVDTYWVEERYLKKRKNVK